MLSCKKCGAQMSGIDLVCKNCGTPWGKKHKSREGIYFSILLLTIAAGIAYIYYIPGVKENFFKSSLGAIFFIFFRKYLCMSIFFCTFAADFILAYYAHACVHMDNADSVLLYGGTGRGCCTRSTEHRAQSTD